MFRCDVCNLGVSSEALLASHHQGKRHLDKVAERQENENLASRSVFLSKFTSPAQEEQVKQALADAGPVQRVLIDKQHGAYAIVEFESNEGAQTALGKKHIQIGQDTISIRPRKVDFGHAPLKAETIHFEQVVEALKTADSKGYAQQVDHLLRTFGISSEQMEERNALARQLEAYVQQFFACRVSIIVFGSSSTGLGTMHADLDLNLEIDAGTSNNGTSSNGHTSNGVTNGSSMAREKEELLKLDATEFRKHPLNASEFTQLTKSDRTRLIRKFVNQYRKEDTVVGQIEAVLDNRCPVIRFLAKKTLLCELSVQNSFGGAKSNFVGDAVAAETSGTLRKFLFGLRIWAQCHLLFGEPAHPDGHWNSYLVSLLGISYLQIKFGVLHMKPTGTDRVLDGWSVNYAFDKFDLGKEDLASMFRAFFTFVTLNLRSENVFSLKDARIYAAEEFREAHYTKDERIEKAFTFATVNVQDPLELSHNVGARVSKHYVTLLRKVMTFGIAQIKADPADFLNIIEMETKLVPKAERTGHDKGNSIEVSVGTAEEAHAIFEALDDLFQNVLGLENAGQSTRKRARFEQDDNSCHVCYAAPFAAWQGRRPVRRTLGKQFPALKPLELEKRVTVELRRAPSSSLGEKPLLFQMHAECDTPAHLTLSFSPLEGEDQTAKDAFHFFDTFLNKYLPDYFPAAGVAEKNVESMDVDA